MQNEDEGGGVRAGRGEGEGEGGQKRTHTFLVSVSKDIRQSDPWSRMPLNFLSKIICDNLSASHAPHGDDAEQATFRIPKHKRKKHRSRYLEITFGRTHFDSTNDLSM